MVSNEEAVVVACAHCGRKNRVLASKAESARCGACKQLVFPNAPVAAGDASWRIEVEGSVLPVLVDFWAPWCGPCRAIAPSLEGIAREKAGRLKVVKVNIDDNPQIAARFDIRSIPTLMVFRDGKVIDQMRGALPRPAIEDRLGKLQI